MSRTRINSKWLSNCTGEELQQMNRLRFKGDSMMYEDVINELMWVFNIGPYRFPPRNRSIDELIQDILGFIE